MYLDNKKLEVVWEWNGRKLKSKKIIYIPFDVTSDLF
jgi:hypothetical protein